MVGATAYDHAPAAGYAMHYAQEAFSPLKLVLRDRFAPGDREGRSPLAASVYYILEAQTVDSWRWQPAEGVAVQSGIAKGAAYRWTPKRRMPGYRLSRSTTFAAGDVYQRVSGGRATTDRSIKEKSL